MNASLYFDFPSNWGAQDLADAVPLRLFELFDASFEPVGVANSPTLQPRAVRNDSYLPTSTFDPPFRIHR